LDRESEIRELENRLFRQSGMQNEEFAEIIEKLPGRTEIDSLDRAMKIALEFLILILRYRIHRGLRVHLFTQPLKMKSPSQKKRTARLHSIATSR
jgi:hypothetical protein